MTNDNITRCKITLSTEDQCLHCFLRRQLIEFSAIHPQSGDDLAVALGQIIADISKQRPESDVEAMLAVLGSATREARDILLEKGN